jgi:hypothetical protein
LVNTVTPIGGGGNAPLTLERPWRLRYDPEYPNYGKVGNVPGSVFTEFLSNYPVEMQFTRDGRPEYYVRDVAAYQAMGNQEVRGEYNDPQFTAGTDDAPVVQEIAARGLYAAAVAKMIRESQPSWTIHVITDGRGRVPRAGERVTIDWKEVSADDDGTFVSLRPGDVPDMKTPYITAVDRVYNERGDAHDEWTLSTTGITLDDGTQTQADSLAHIDAAILAVQNTTVIITAQTHEDVDASASPEHAAIVKWRAPDDLSRWVKVTVDVWLEPLRQQVRTSENPTGTQIIAVGGVDIVIPAHDDINALAANIGGIPEHVHGMGVIGATKFFTVSGTPATIAPNGYLWVGGSGDDLVLNANGASGRLFTGTPPATGVNLAPTSHPHVVKKKDEQIAHIPAGTALGPLPQHVHPIPTDINNTTSPTQAFLSLDNGDGTFRPLSAALKDTRSGQSGPWSADFSINDIARYCGGAGKLHQLKVASGANADQGRGKFRVLVTARAEIGGLGTNFQINPFH